MITIKSEREIELMRHAGMLVSKMHQFIKPYIKEGITKVRVYMWVEGQDVDCEDKASGGSLSFNLAFSIDGKNQE